MAQSVQRQWPSLPEENPQSLALWARQITRLLQEGTIASSDSVNSRESLAANRTYYVRTDGNDSNNGLTNSAAGAFLTIDRARAAAYALDLNGSSITVQIADGTYTTGTTCAEMPPGSTFGTPITFQGNAAAPGNVIVSTTSAHCFVAQNGAFIFVKDMELRTTTAGDCLAAVRGGQITYGNIRFGACAAFHKEAIDHGRIYNSGNYSIVGSAVAHEHLPNLAYILNLSCTVTLVGTPNFSAFYIGAALCGCAQYVAVTFSGGATGVRYLVHKNAVIDTNSGGANFFPGNAAGSQAEGGIYQGLPDPGSSIGKQSIWIPASAWKSFTTSGPGSLVTLELVAANSEIVSLDFDPSTGEFIHAEVAMPKSWNVAQISAKVLWSHPATVTNFGVTWQIAAHAVSDDDPFGFTLVAATQVTDTGGTTNDLYITAETSALTIGGSPAAQDLVSLRIARLVGDAGDNLAVDARFHGLMLFYTTNAVNDA